MTIGPLPSRTDMIKAVTGGPLIVSADTLSQLGFADTLRAVAAPDAHDKDADNSVPHDRAKGFNEYGFFANFGAIDITKLSITTPPTGVESPTEMVEKAGQQAEPFVTSLHASLPTMKAYIPDTLASLDFGRVALTPVKDPAHSAPSSAGQSTTPSSAPALMPRLIPLAGPSADHSTTRTASFRPTQPIAAKSPISVSFDTNHGAAAVTVSAYGLTDSESDALHADIAALLHRHGLSIGDLRLNGRPMGQGRDRSGT